MTIDFYYMPSSAPCRTVLLTAKAVGIELNLKYLDYKKQEHLSEEFVKINPQHVVPTIVDDGFVLWESRAIATYLVEEYAKDDTLYPKDIKLRALVNQRLYFDMGTLYPCFAEYYYPVLVKGASRDPEKYKKMEDAFDLLNKFLEGKDFLVGKNLTVADLSAVATVSTYEALEFDMSKYPNVTRWYDKVKNTAVGYEEANAKNIVIFKQLVAEYTKK